MARPLRPADGRRRRRRGRWAAVAGVVLLAAGGAAAHRLGRAAQRADQFRLAAVEVRGLRLLTGQEVVAASRVPVGANLFALDLDDVAQRLDSLAWVRRVRLERQPPDRLVVHIQERRRVAWVEWRGRLHGIDEEGVLLPSERLPAEGVRDLDLPVLRMAEGDSLGARAAVGRAVEDVGLRRLLAWWLTASSAAPELAEEISEISSLDGQALRLRLVADDLEVRLPGDRVAERLAALPAVLARVYGDVPDPAYVDLRFEGQAVVGAADGAASSGGPGGVAGSGDPGGQGGHGPGAAPAPRGNPGDGGAPVRPAQRHG